MGVVDHLSTLVLRILAWFYDFLRIGYFLDLLFRVLVSGGLGCHHKRTKKLVLNQIVS